MLKQIPIAVLAALSLLAGSASAVKPPAPKAPPAAKEWTDALLTKALSAPHAKEFNTICVKALVDENCLFIKSAGDYAAQADNKKRGALSEMIMNYYVGKDSKKEINLPATMAETLTTKYAAAKKSKNFPANLFAPAAGELRKLMLVNLRNPQRIKDWDTLLAKIK